MVCITLCDSLIPASVCENIIQKTYDWLKRRIRGPGQPVGSLPFESLAGRKEIENYLERMTEFLHDKKATVLGIHGMRGIGKTILLKKFNDELVRRCARRRFAHIIFIEVSQSPDFKKIKGDIEEQIGGKLSSLRKSRFLLMLDDVCQEVDLSKMGIPIVPSNENKCKVILTSRSQSHCRLHGVVTTKFLGVTLLPEDEAWNFFKRNLGRDLDQEGGEIVEHARNIVKRCGGLPGALKIIGMNMAKASSVDAWREAERNLSTSSRMIEGVAEDVLHFLDHESPGPGQPVGSLPHESLAGQDQINDNLKRMEEFLDDDEARVLGIYGMGGIGKTTLLRQFNDKLFGRDSRRRFDHIIFIEVSQSPNIERIKRDVEEIISGKLLSLTKSRFLLLLDDVWEEVDLMSWGIPIPSFESRSKVIMTGRSKSFCRIKHVVRLDATQSFEVSGLSKSEAWIFFQRNVGRNLNSEGREIAKLAKSVAKKCSGHPLALEVVGKSMENATSINEWREAERKLIRSPQMIEGFKDVIRLMTFSFDRLRDDNIRNCLLYICLWGEDIAIPKDDLIDYWFGEGFLDCDDSESLYEARDRGHENITTLVSCSLLQKASKDNKYVRMHDVVRDMCKCLTSREFDKYGKFYAYLKGYHNDSSSTTTLANVRRLSAKTNWYSREKTLPKDFIPSPHLETLLCGRNYYPSFQIEEGFFQNCSSVRVLELKTCVLNFALKDLTLLKELRYLGLSCTKLRNLPDEIGSFSNLVYLDLSWNENLENLPDTIGNLLKLQKLDLSYTRLKVLPITIGSLTKLEILYLSKGTGWEFSGNNPFLNYSTFRHLATYQYTKMQFTPDSIHDLYNLRHLVLSDAPSSLDNIEHLNLNNYEFDSLPYPNGALKMLYKLLFSNLHPKLSICKILKDFNLSQREISTIPDSIGQLTMLRELDLSQTKISTLPKSIRALTMLKSLYLSQTEISILPDYIGDLINVDRLDLFQSKVSTLPDSIGALKALTYLDLSQTKVSMLPESIRTLTMLKELYLSQTEISILPDYIGDLINLDWLSLFQTKVSMLPNSIGALKVLRVLNLSQTKVSVLPESIRALTMLKTLYLWQTEISILPEYIGDLINLDLLDLSETKVSTLPNSISALKVLTYLDLSQTKVAVLPESIRALTMLKTLYLSQTKISVLPDSIRALTMLKTLDLSQTEISILPDSIGALINLEWLSFSQTKVSVLPDSIRALTRLKTLDLSQTEISILPDCICALINLNWLYLSQTKISVLLDSIRALTMLKFLDLLQTEISILPDCICALINLNWLYLSQTKISVLPDSIRALTMLKELHLSQTEISILPDSIGALINLEWLDLSQTKVSTFPDSIGALKVLRVLKLSQTKVSVLPDSIRALTMLKELDLSQTEISILPDSIGALINLDWLSLSQTKVSVLPDSIGALKVLRVFILSQTKVSVLPDSIRALTMLKTLDVSQTEISILPDSIVALKNLKTLGLSQTKVSVS